MRIFLILLAIVQFNVQAHEFIDNSIYPPHNGSYVTSFDKIRTPSDTFIVVDNGPDNDRESYRNDAEEYEFTFDINIRRYVGTETDITNLLKNNLISKKAKIYIPAFDVDEFVAAEDLFLDCDGDEILDEVVAEIDEVYFNGKRLSTLHGYDKTWVLNEASTPNIFEVDIEDVNFPASPGETANNKIQIKIDVGNSDKVGSDGGSCVIWETSVDYVAFEFDVVDPVLLVVGLLGDPDIFEDANSDYENALREMGIQAKVITHGLDSDQGCYVFAAPGYAFHGNELLAKAMQYATEHGTNKLNIIAHSKGGLDSRHFITTLDKEDRYIDTQAGGVSNPLKVHSYVSLSSPHLGSAVADAIRWDLADNWLIGNVDYADYLITDICDLATDNSSLFNALNPLPSSINSLSVGANADADNNGVLTNAELEFNPLPAWLPDIYAQRFHQIIRDTEYVGFESGYVYDASVGATVEVEKPVLVQSLNGGQKNDIFVGINSAAGVGADKHINTIGNHTTLVYKNNSGAVYTGVRDIVFSEGLNGVLKWSVK